MLSAGNMVRHPPSHAEPIWYNKPNRCEQDRIPKIHRQRQSRDRLAFIASACQSRRGWAMRLVTMFPKRAAHDQSLFNLANPSTDYPNIRVAAARLLKAGHINDVLAASYARLLVDEYQDCSTRQHSMVCCASAALPTCVVGDPIQAIFDFGDDPLPDWDQDVCKYFPLTGELSRPWRWINAGAEELGDWLLEVRRKLLAGEPIDLTR